MATKGFNPFEMAQKQFDGVADLLELDQPTRDLLRQPLREYHFSIPVRMDDGKVQVFRGFRVPAQRRPRPLQGRHPLPPAGDHRHRPGPGHVDDLEVLRGRHPARRRQGRRHLRPAQPQPARAGAHLPRLGPPGRQRTSARCSDVPAPDVMTNAQHMLWMLDEFETDPRRQVPRLHHRQARRHGRLAGPDRGHRLRRGLHPPRGAARS